MRAGPEDDALVHHGVVDRHDRWAGVRGDRDPADTVVRQQSKARLPAQGVQHGVRCGLAQAGCYAGGAAPQVGHGGLESVRHPKHERRAGKCYGLLLDILQIGGSDSRALGHLPAGEAEILAAQREPPAGGPPPWSHGPDAAPCRLGRLDTYPQWPVATCPRLHCGLFREALQRVRVVDLLRGT